MDINVTEWAWVMNATGKMTLALLADAKRGWSNPASCSFVFVRLLRTRTL